MLGTLELYIWSYSKALLKPLSSSLYIATLTLHFRHQSTHYH